MCMLKKISWYFRTEDTNKKKNTKLRLIVTQKSRLAWTKKNFFRISKWEKYVEVRRKWILIL